MTKFVQASIGLFLGWILATVIFWAAGWGAAYGAEYKFKTIAMPDARHTLVYGINNLGDVVGLFQDCDQCRPEGFLYSDGQYYDVTVANGFVIPRAINRSGTMAGSIVQPQLGQQYGIVFDGEQSTILDKAVFAFGLTNKNVAVGYEHHAGPQYAFIWKDGVYTRFMDPSLIASLATGINNQGDIVGYYLGLDNLFHGFVRKAGVISAIPIIPFGINRDGLIVGLAGAGNDGAVLENGIITRINYPGSDHTQVYGVNNKGHLVGYYQKAGQYFGFIAKPVLANK